MKNYQIGIENEFIDDLLFWLDIVCGYYQEIMVFINTKTKKYVHIDVMYVCWVAVFKLAQRITTLTFLGHFKIETKSIIPYRTSKIEQKKKYFAVRNFKTFESKNVYY